MSLWACGFDSRSGHIFLFQNKVTSRKSSIPSARFTCGYFFISIPSRFLRTTQPQSRHIYLFHNKVTSRKSSIPPARFTCGSFPISIPSRFLRTTQSQSRHIFYSIIKVTSQKSSLPTRKIYLRFLPYLDSIEIPTDHSVSLLAHLFIP